MNTLSVHMAAYLELAPLRKMVSCSLPYNNSPLAPQSN